MRALRGFGAVFYKEMLHARRDRLAIVFALVMPLMQMVILGTAIDTNVRQVPTVVFDASGVNLSAGRHPGQSRFQSTDCAIPTPTHLQVC